MEERLHRLLRQAATCPDRHDLRRPGVGGGTTPPTDAAPWEGQERKIVTILFADVTGSTALGDQLDPERLRALLGAYFRTMSTVIEAWGGSVEKFIGDAVMAVFGVPSVREDDASRALHAALEMQQRLVKLNQELARDHNVTLEIRTGVNTGEVVAPMGDTPSQRIVAGDAVNVAARLEQVAEPGTILVGERTHAATSTAFEFEQPTQVTLKGKPDPLPAFRLIRALPEATRGIPGLRAPLIGRDAEMATLLAAQDEAVETGSPRLVLVFGPAGIGKSRLAAEFVVAAQERHPGLQYLRGRCLAAGEGITYWALAEILRGAFGIGLDDPADVVADRMRAGVAATLTPLALDRSEVELTTQALAATIGVKLGEDAPPIHADELARAWPRFATALATSAPVIWLIEDLHWADAAALDMIERIATRTSGPLVILATARPEFLETHPGFGAAGGAPPAALSLRPLTDAQGTELVERLLMVADLPAPLHVEILAKAEGNPFFVEEIVRRLIDEGVLVQEGDHWRATSAALTTTIPDSIYALLAARVDALAAAERRVLQEAAVIGRTFWAAAVAHAIPGNGVAETLALVERKGLVLVRPTSSLSGQEEFAFRHALVRDVAYASLPKARRARAHAEAGDWIAELAGQRSDEFAELMAFHYETAIAGEDADLAWLGDATQRDGVRAKAYASLLAAGRVARRQYALDRAVDLHQRALEMAINDVERMEAYEQIGRDHDLAFHGELALAGYRAAIDLARDDPAQAGRLARLARRAGSLVAMRGGSFEELPDHVEVDNLIGEGLEAVTERRERAALLLARAEMALRWSVSGRTDPLGTEQRMAAAEEAKRIAGELDDARLAFEAADILSDLKLVMGDYEGSAHEVMDALPLLDRIDVPAAKAAALFEAAQAVLVAGDPSHALQLGEQSSALARHMSAHDQMHATSVIMSAADWAGDWDRVESALAEHLANFAQEANVHCLNVQSGPNRGAVVVARRGDPARARELVQQAVFEATPGAIQATAAEVLVAVGDPNAGLATARDVLARGPRWRQPEATIAAIHALEALEDWPALGELADGLGDLRSASPYLDAHADRALGRSLVAAGRVGDGVEALRRSIETFDRVPVVFEAARTREALADAVPEERDQLLTDALATYERLGAAPHVERVRRKLGDR
ncbi:MAG TPA: adenylate/guanylate cyclase domain-containing protein [Candidatus Limnocylindria bacterium]